MNDAKEYLEIGKKKVNYSIFKMIILGILAGFFIALAAFGSNIAYCDIHNFSIKRILAALIFPLGLIFVIIFGAELFTGSSLLLIPLLDKKINIKQMLKNWFFVYFGNFIGSMLLVGLLYLSKQYNNETLAIASINVGITKTSYTFVQALSLGVLCNILVCLGVWFGLLAKRPATKVLLIFFPIFIFILCGFEHSIANMYYLPTALIYNLIDSHGLITTSLTIKNALLNNLLPVTIGNIIGGGLMGIIIWYLYIKEEK